MHQSVRELETFIAETEPFVTERLPQAEFDAPDVEGAYIKGFMGGMAAWQAELTREAETKSENDPKTGILNSVAFKESAQQILNSDRAYEKASHHVVMFA